MLHTCPSCRRPVKQNLHRCPSCKATLGTQPQERREVPRNRFVRKRSVLPVVLSASSVVVVAVLVVILVVRSAGVSRSSDVFDAKSTKAAEIGNDAGAKSSDTKGMDALESKIRFMTSENQRFRKEINRLLSENRSLRVENGELSERLSRRPQPVRKEALKTPQTPSLVVCSRCSGEGRLTGETALDLEAKRRTLRGIAKIRQLERAGVPLDEAKLERLAKDMFKVERAEILKSWHLRGGRTESYATICDHCHGSKWIKPRR